MKGLRVMVRKELREQWRTRRLPIVAVAFAIVGIGSVVLTYYLPDLIGHFGTGEVVIEIPPPTMREAVLQLQDNLGQSAILVAILLAMGSVAGERERGVAALLLSQPLSRPAYLLAKAGGLVATLVAGILAATIGAFIYIVILFDSPSAGGFVVMALFVLLPTLLFGAITFLGSVVTGSPAGAAGVGLAGLLGVGVASLLPGVAAWLPSPLGAAGLAFATGQPAKDWMGPLVVTMAGIAVAFAAAVISFRRQELG